MRWANRNHISNKTAGQKKISFPVDTVVVLPDDQPILLQVVYDKNKLHIDRLESAIYLQLLQFNNKNVKPVLDIEEQSGDFTWNYAVIGDTIEINTDALLSLNPIVDGEYTYLWRFSARLENSTREIMVSDWVHSDTIRLVKPEKMIGVRQKLKLIF